MKSKIRNMKYILKKKKINKYQNEIKNKPSMHIY